MAKPITNHTVESLMANTIEVGDCLEWQGYFATDKYTPYVCHGGKMVAVRKLLATLEGRDSPKAVYWGVTCDNWRCVHPEHTVGRTSAQHIVRMAKAVEHKSASRIAKLQEAARKRDVCKVKDEATAQAIRMDPRSCSKTAAAFGISKSLAAKIKSGKAWKQVSATANPWGGLMR